MLTYGQLRQGPGRIGEVDAAYVLIAASGDAEVVLREARRNPEATAVFQHETISMMRAERASEVEKLRQQVSPKSVVLGIRKKPGSIWDHVTVGRAATNDIVLGDPAVSNVHAHFELDVGPHPVSIQDLGSSNGTFVNREPLQPHRQVPLRVGDCLRFGQTVFYLVSAAVLKELLR